MLRYVTLSLLLSLSVVLNPASASDEFAQPLKPHQLLSRISGFQLRDPKDGYETFNQACTRIQNVLEQAIPKQKQPTSDRQGWPGVLQNNSQIKRIDQEWSTSWIEGQLGYAEKIYALVMRTAISKELDRKVRTIEPAYDEDGQTESIRHPQLFDLVPAARELIAQFSFMLPIDEETYAPDKLLSYWDAYMNVSKIHCIQQEIALSAIDSLCPYKMSEAEKNSLEKTFASFSDERMNEELRALPLSLHCISYLNEFNIRYIDLLCCKEEPNLGAPRLKALQKLQAVCEFIARKKKEKESKN